MGQSAKSDLGLGSAAIYRRFLSFAGKRRIHYKKRRKIAALQSQTDCAWMPRQRKCRKDMAGVPGIGRGTRYNIVGSPKRSNLMATVEYGHILVAADGVAMLAGTQTKVVEIVLDHLAHGSDATEIHREFPHLSLGQIHSALGYYYDHKAELDEDMERRRQEVEAVRAEIGDGPLSGKLRATGRLP
jgi:uncharacterized protein (DUF433 family)